MILSAIVLLSLLQVRDPMNAGRAGAFASYLDGQKLEFVVNRTDLLSAPRWATADDAPPLAPRAAVRAALELLPKVLPAEDLNHWSVRLISLQSLVQSDTWVYIVELERAHVCAAGAVCSGMEGPATTLRMVVLMSGRAIAPTVTPDGRDLR